MKTRYLDNVKISIFLLVNLVLSYAFICMTKNCFSAAMVFIVDEGHMTKLETGTISAVFYAVYAILQICGGVVTDKWRPEIFITIGLFGAGIANTLVYFFNTNYVAVLIIWALNAAVQFGVWPATFKLVSTMLEDSISSIGMLIVTFSNPLGVMAGYAVAALVPTWQTNFLVSGIGLFIIGAIFVISFGFIGKRLTVKETVRVEYKSEAKGERGFLSLLLSSGLVFILFFTLVRTMFDIGLKSLAPSMIKESYENVDPVLATVLSIIVLVCGVLGPIFSQLVYPRLIKNEVLACAVFFGAGIPVTAVLLFIGQINYWFIVAALATVVFLMSATGLFTTSFIATKFNKWGKGATVAGLLNCLASLGIVLTNVVFTALAENIGWRGTAVIWLILMISAALLAVFATPVWRKFKKNNNLI